MKVSSIVEKLDPEELYNVLGRGVAWRAMKQRGWLRGPKRGGCYEKQTTMLPIQCFSLTLYYFYFLSYKECMLSSSASLPMAILLKLIIFKSLFLTSAFFSDAQHQLGYKSVIYYYQVRSLQVITHVVQPRYRDSQKCFHHIPAGIS